MIDAHAHLQDDKYTNVDNVVKESVRAGVGKIICSSYDIASSKLAVELAEKYNDVYATIGIHPHDAKSLTKNAIEELKKLSKNKKVVAIGEIGLDYHYMLSNKEEQKEAFLAQIELANELALPMVIHSRDAVGDTIDILRENLNKLKNGVCIHCFNMSIEILKEITKYGFYISVGGIVTFKNANNIVEVIKECDMDKLMLETDAPYLAPVPYRSNINEPKYVPVIAQKIADIKNISLEEVEIKTTNNAIRFFNLK